jgi:hypothetical protein
MGKKSIREEKKFKRKKNQIENILRKKIKKY